MAEFDISIHALLAESDRGAGRIQRHRDHFYPRSPCGERHQLLAGAIASVIISIHALLAESDDHSHGLQKQVLAFLSTLSLRRATAVITVYPPRPSYFYPRSPCGERLDVNNPVLAVTSISIHALLAESDVSNQCQIDQKRNFYPRSPCGERQTLA